MPHSKLSAVTCNVLFVAIELAPELVMGGPHFDVIHRGGQFAT